MMMKLKTNEVMPKEDKQGSIQQSYLNSGHWNRRECGSDREGGKLRVIQKKGKVLMKKNEH